MSGGGPPPGWGKLPRTPGWPGQVGHVFRRAPFLEGTSKAYYGPGQAPDGMDDAAGYRAPLDWPAADTLLRRPQQVWLSLAFINTLIEDYTANYSHTIVGWIYACVTGTEVYDTAPRSYTWQDGHVEDWVPAPPPPLENGMYQPGTYPYVVSNDESGHILGNQPNNVLTDSVSVPNWNYVEYNRILPIVRSVKARIEALRPGRTWVDLVDYSDPYQQPNDRIPSGNADGDITLGDRYGFVIAPDPSEQYFGTDFLHIYVGGITYRDGSPGGDVDPTRNNTSDPVYLAGRAQVVGSYPRFGVYRTVLFAVGALLQQQLLEPLTPISIPASPCPGQSGGAPPQALLDVNTQAVQQVETKNAALAAEGPDEREFFSAIAQDLAKYGYSYGGDSTLMTEESLVELIASVFGFDPNTGVDLPPG